jgi:hypothetical protein
MRLRDKTVNPYGKTHGAPTDDTRHVGDLGNFKTDAQGNGKGTTTDKLIKLIGAESVIGVCSSIRRLGCRLTFRSAPLSSTPELMISAREVTKSL